MHKIILSHPTGNANVRAVLEALYRSQTLAEFHTTIATYPNNIFGQLAKLPGLNEFSKRQYLLDAYSHTHTYPTRELGRMVAQKLKLKQLLIKEKGVFSIDQIYWNMDQQVAKSLNIDDKKRAVYAYEDGALATFRKAHELNMMCMYDLPIGYWRSMRALLDEEREKNPEWAITLGGFDDSEYKLARKDEELALADFIFVASEFTKKTLKAYPKPLAPIHVIPYGFPEANMQRQYYSTKNRKIKLLYVGGLSQRKGLSYIFDAIQDLTDYFELTVVGRGDIDSCPALQRALGKHHYIPALAHADILDLMAKSDIFLFPSLFEGFGLVITEAMSQGTPVITTDRTCGPDVINHGENGWLIESGSKDQLKDCLVNIMKNPDQLETLGKAARLTALERNWNDYGKDLIKVLEKAIV
ncbi:glycosyltransferase family 4 protein [Acinetobacter soli]|uniref:glycosyltransferase family 4 protein n=1 Tax=Acinetobacter soli TaxID=487316 RepID=UPI002D7F075F|nr:glycosyltransferase family 4 protein [Acinetobacter soli]MEB4800905.1 glycosyltransferase family 4 protein [Acinetobacter soli]